eukprot:scaffold292529_cov31-Tisochrysis_lutea.AAC.4
MAIWKGMCEQFGSRPTRLDAERLHRVWYMAQTSRASRVCEGPSASGSCSSARRCPSVPRYWQRELRWHEPPLLTPSGCLPRQA